MQDIESKFHSLLKEISGEAYSIDEQSKIVAFASSIYSNFFKNKRLANKLDKRVIDAKMNDAILKAMSSLNEWEDFSDEYIDSSELDSNQLMRKLAQTSKSKWGMQEVLNPEVLSYLDFDEDNIESEETLENAQQTNEALITPGHGKHRTDFQSSPNR